MHHSVIVVLNSSEPPMHLHVSVSSRQSSTILTEVQ